MKKVFILGLCILVQLGLARSTFAASIINVKVGDEILKFTDQTGYPFVDGQGRMQIPFRIALQNIGAEVKWDNNMAIGIKDGVTVKVPINCHYIIRDHEKIPTDTSAQTISGITYLPIRPVMEAFGYNVSLTGDTLYIEEKEAVKIKLEGKNIIFSNEIGKPFIDSQGIVMVPVNGIFKALGMDEIQISSGRVMGNYKGDMIELYSDGRFFVGEAKVGNISNIRSVNNIIYAPIELLMEKLGYEVTFKESEIDIVKAKSDHIQYNKLQSLMYKRLSVEQKQEELLLISKMLDDNAYSKINRTKLEKLRSSSLEEVKKEISTIYDLVTYLKLKEFSMDSGVLGEQQIKDNARKMTYHYNFSAEEVFKNNVANCGGIANLVKYILGDNYEELGYVHTADGSGGHVINYFFKDGYYYLVDFTDFIDDSGDGMFRGRYKNMQDIVNEYGKGQELVYYYSNYEYQIPSGHAYDSSDLSRYIPKGYEVYILKENKATGHVIKYADGFPNTILPKKMNKNN